MRPIAIDLYGQSGQHAHLALQPGWNPLPALKLGVWVYGGSLTIWNALAGAGELFLDRIEVTFDSATQGFLPRSNWSVAGPLLTIGAGHEYMAPRAPLNVRWDYSHRCPSSVRYGPVKLDFTPAMKRDIFTALAHTLPAVRSTGMWAPFGDKQPDTPGGQGIAAIAGWEQDGAGFLLRHDLVMERMPIGYLDVHTGQPVIAPPSYYNTVRGWGKTTQLDAFTNPVHAMYDDSRVPLVTWAGTSPYRDLMLGTQRWNGYLPYDAQHLCRASTPVRAAAQCGDPAAQFSLAMIAADCASGTDYAPGSRDMAWTIDALAYYRPTFVKARALIDRNVAAQTASGSIMRASFGAWQPSPSPWTVSETIPVPIPTNIDVDAVGLERMLTCHALGLDNRTITIQRAMAGTPWPVPKYVGVAPHGGAPFPAYQLPVGHAGWEVWIGLGAAAALGVEGWQQHALDNPTPAGHSTAKQKLVNGVMVDRSVLERLAELRTILRAETVGNEQTVGVLCVLESLHLS